MPEYIFAYHGGKAPESPEEGAKEMEKWNKWIADLGDQMINPGSPVGMSKTVSIDGVEDHGGANPLMGYSVIKADSMDAVLEIAKSCPYLNMETATIEVAEIMQLS